MNGWDDYYNHSRSYPSYTEGYDFWDDDEVLYKANGTYSTTLFQDKAVDIIRGHDSSKPLFLYLPFQSVHYPVQVPKVYQDLYSEKRVDLLRQKYLGMVTAMDDAVGNVTQALKESGLYENTIIVFFSDNGGPTGRTGKHGSGNGASNWPLRGGKGSVFEGGTRTPAFIHSARFG